MKNLTIAYISSKAWGLGMQMMGQEPITCGYGPGTDVAMTDQVQWVCSGSADGGYGVQMGPGVEDDESGDDCKRARVHGHGAGLLGCSSTVARADWGLGTAVMRDR